MLTYKQVEEKAGSGNIVPVAVSAAADTLTPVAAFLRLRRKGQGAFLLESVEGGERVARYSFLGVEPFAALSVRNGAAWLERDGERKPLPGNPFHALGAYLSQFHAAEDASLPRFSGGAVGWIGYEMIRFLERVPARPDGGEEDDARLMLFRSLVAFDHVRQRLLFISHVPAEKTRGLRARYKEACDAVESLRERTLQGRSEGKTPFDFDATEKDFPKFRTALGREGFCAGVRKIQRHIRAGDIFQCVLAERFEAPLAGDAFAFYRALRTVNPSPYMFHLDSGDGGAVLGASPERLVRVEGGEIETCPIAGTRARGADAEDDARLERNLLSSVKERAEHLMLVDLGRNDVGRVARPGSVRVENFMHVERYSHVMHLVSLVKGRLREGLSAWDAFAACFPAGTVTGAPKIRAMEVLHDIEPTRRGAYAGAVVYHDFRGNLDSAITIRSAVVRSSPRGERTVRVQAGAGVVADSSPAREWDEVNNKARAMFEAARMANAWPSFQGRSAK